MHHFKFAFPTMEIIGLLVATGFKRNLELCAVPTGNYYGASKEANERMSRAYAYLSEARLAGSRFYKDAATAGHGNHTVDSRGRDHQIFKNRDMNRDFTCVDDGPTVRLNDHPAGLANSSGAYVRLLEEASRKKAKCELLPVQPGDVPATYADIGDLVHDVKFVRVTPIAEGIARFIDWHRL